MNGLPWFRAALACWLILPPLTARQENPATQEKEEEARFTANVEQVVLYVSVYGAGSQIVSSLTKSDFMVFEDKIQQEINYFGLDDVPSTIGVVMDSSGSMRGKVDLVNSATQKFLEQNHPQNELFLIDFKDEVSLEEDFTRDPLDIQDALDNIIISGGTALYDAIFLALDKAREGSEAKKAILVFTDGEDKDSYYQQHELVDKIRESDVQVYIVAFLDTDLSEGKGIFGLFKSQREKVELEITTIADTSGGKSFFPEDINELDEVFSTIARELRSQYRLAYTPGNKSRDGQWRNIDVVVQGTREKSLKVRTRKGYYAK